MDRDWVTEGWDGAGWEGRPLPRTEQGGPRRRGLRYPQVFEQREESSRQYAIFSDSGSAADRIRSDSMGRDSASLMSSTRWAAGSPAVTAQSPSGEHPHTRESGAMRPPTPGQGRCGGQTPGGRPGVPTRDQSVAHDKKGDGGQVPGHRDWIAERVGTRRYRPPIGSNIRQKGAQGLSRSLLPVPPRPYSNRILPVRQDREDR